MKVIDLLNKIAKGEEAPTRISIRGFEFKTGASNSIENYFVLAESNEKWLDSIDIKLSDEVEIIEEEKDIDKWGKGALEEIKTKTDYKIKDLQKYIEILMETQNEIIDAIKELKNK